MARLVMIMEERIRDKGLGIKKKCDAAKKFYFYPLLLNLLSRFALLTIFVQKR